MLGIELSKEQPLKHFYDSLRLINMTRC